MCIDQTTSLCSMADEVLSVWLATPTDSSQFVRVWHFTSKSCLASMQEDRQTLAAIYSSDYKYFATAGSNHAILVYDASTNQVMNSLEARWGCVWGGSVLEGKI